MADKKITEFNALTAVADTDVLPIVDDPGGSAETKKITRADLVGSETITLEAGKVIKGDGGTVALPMVAVTGDENTGMYAVGADKMGFAAGGVKQGGFDNTSGSEGFEASGNLVMKADRQLVAADFPSAAVTALYNLDNAASGDLTDVSGNAHTLTLVAGTVASGNDVLGVSRKCQSDGSVYWQSTSADFNVANTADTDDFLVGGWVYIPDTTAASQCLFSNCGGANNGWQIYQHASSLYGRLDLATDLSTPPYPLKVASGYFHIVFAREVGVGLKLYINGTKIGGTTADGSIGTTQSKFQLGGYNGATHVPATGTRWDECFFIKGTLPTNLDDVVRGLYARSAKKFVAKDANTNIVLPQNINDLFDIRRFKIISATRDMTAAGAPTSVSYTGVGFKPSGIIAWAFIDGTTYFAMGMSDSTPDYTTVDMYAADSWSYTADFLYIANAGGSQKCTITSYDNDGFTLSWTKTTLPTGTAQIRFMCFR